jgi:cysteinyl-tRNA synthetase
LDVSLVSWVAGIIVLLAECHMMRHHQECLSIIGNPIMKLKLVIAISALAAMMPAFAQAKQGETPPNAPTSTMAQVQKVIQIISGNKTKLQQYCEIATKLDPQIAEAVQKNDANKLEALVKQADDLAQKIGAEYVALMDGLPQIDENSREGKQIAAALDSLDKLCATK